MQDEKGVNNEVKASVGNFDLGGILNLESTPEEERKVLWKLDLL